MSRSKGEVFEWERLLYRYVILYALRESRDGLSPPSTVSALGPTRGLRSRLVVSDDDGGSLLYRPSSRSRAKHSAFSTVALIRNMNSLSAVFHSKDRRAGLAAETLAFLGWP